jgi:hypothetical protein
MFKMNHPTLEETKSSDQKYAPSRAIQSSTDYNEANKSVSYIFRTPRGKSTVLKVSQGISYDNFLRAVLEKSAVTDRNEELRSISPATKGMRRSRRKINPFHGRIVKRRVDEVVTCTFTECSTDEDDGNDETKEDDRNIMDVDRENLSQLAYVVHNGKILDKREYGQFIETVNASSQHMSNPHHISLHLRLRGGIDRQNRVGSKFGGGGVSSAQNSERERKERLRQLALETVDLAKDPYLMRNHLGTYECKLCLTLHTNEG